MYATINVCSVQLHCDVSVGFTSVPVCLRCYKKRGKKRRLDNAVAGTSKILSFFVTTTAGEDETCEGNPGNSNSHAFDVAPPVPAPERRIGGGNSSGGTSTRTPPGPILQELGLYLTVDNQCPRLSQKSCWTSGPTTF